MIIAKIKKHLTFFTFLFVLAIARPSSAQPIQPPPKLMPAPTFGLLNTGYGAAALGLGGAFTAVADDLSAIYWNPAGVGQLDGLQILLDYRIMGDSDEDIGAEAFANTSQSPQRYSISGNQFNAVNVSYSFRTRAHNFVPMFAWQKTSNFGPERELKETAEVIASVPSTLFYQSRGTFLQEFTGSEEEFAFGLAALVSPKIAIGGSWSFLRGGPEYKVTGNFHETAVLLDETTASADMQLTQEYREKISGNYLKIGALFYPNRPISFGAYLRFPHTRKGEVTSRWNGTSASSSGTTPFDVSATARTEVEVPMEWSFGAAIRPRAGVITAASVTYSNWSEVVRVTDSSSSPLIVNGQEPFPTLRANAGEQFELLQWRAGAQYKSGQGPYGLVMRSGIFRDGQPFSNKENDRVGFNGYSFGIGYLARGFRFDIAFVKESGKVTFTSQSREPSTFSNRRFLFTFTYIGL